MGYTKVERFLHKNQHTQLLNFENWCNGEVSNASAKMQLSKSIFRRHKSLESFSIFSLKNANLGARFFYNKNF